MYKVKTTPQFDAWIEALKDRPTRIRLKKRLDKASRGLLGDVKNVGADIFEMREFFGAGWRMYYTLRGDVLVVMLGGGDKSTQNADIQAAIDLAQTIGE